MDPGVGFFLRYKPKLFEKLIVNLSCNASVSEPPLDRRCLGPVVKSYNRSSHHGPISCSLSEQQVNVLHVFFNRSGSRSTARQPQRLFSYAGVGKKFARLSW